MCSSMFPVTDITSLRLTTRFTSMKVIGNLDS